MMRRFLFGPLASSQAQKTLARFLQDGTCLTFDDKGSEGLILEPTDTWESFSSRFPEDWRPDGMLLRLPWKLPSWLPSLPIPLVALARDWQIHWHHYRCSLPTFDLVLTDPSGVEKLVRAGITQAVCGPIGELDQVKTDEPVRGEPIEVDVLLVGWLDPFVNRLELPLLRSLAKLANRWRVVVAKELEPENLRRFQAKVVIYPGGAGELPKQVLNAMAQGALLFAYRPQPIGGRLCQDREELVVFAQDNLVNLVEYYLGHENERQAIVQKARTELLAMSPESCWTTIVKLVEEQWAKLEKHVAKRPMVQGKAELTARCWQMFATKGQDSSLIRDLVARVALYPAEAESQNLLGLALAWPARESSITLEMVQAALKGFGQALRAEPFHAVAGLNLVEALLRLNQKEQAREQAQKTLLFLAKEGLPAGLLQAGHFPPVLDLFGVEWERSAWENAGDLEAETAVKTRLLQWRLLSLLAELTGDWHYYYYEALLVRPDLPGARGALGSALVRHGLLQEAVSHLHRAVHENPLDLGSARALYFVLGELGDFAGQRELARDLGLFQRLQLVWPENWFREAIPTKGIPLPQANRPLRLTWRGSFTALHSFAIVNRQICARLLALGYDLSCQPPPEPGLTSVNLLPALASCLDRDLPPPVDCTIGHRWPPDFTPPREGYWVVMQPWEFGSLPQSWLFPLTQVVDEVWVPSVYVKESFVKSGLPQDRVQVIPLGVSALFWERPVQNFPLKTQKKYKFLFVGGTIHRKGFDLLLKAYSEVFTKKDDVCLVVKDMGAATFYRGQGSRDHIAKIQENPQAPEIEYLDRDLTEEELADLYGSCDCLVHPYRGEGFGLPIAEAMARGLPVITTGYGPALDYCTPANSYLLPARLLTMPEKRVGQDPTIDYPWLAEPDLDMLRYLLRYLLEHPDEGKEKGRQARAAIRDHFTWDHTVAAIVDRLNALHQRPVRRLGKGHSGEQAAVVPAVPASTEKPLLSLCLIVRNEEKNLPACLGSVGGLADEIVVVDMGSTDATKQVAKGLGAKVFDFPWADSYASARNESLRQARGQWIFWMDPGDRLDQENRQRLRKLVANLPEQNVAYVLKYLTLPNDIAGAVRLVDQVRLFRNDPRHRWSYRVQEQILPALRLGGGEIGLADVVIRQEAVRQVLPQEHLLRLLKMDYAANPHDSWVLFNLAWGLKETGQTAEALTFFQKSIRLGQAGDLFMREIFPLMIQCHRQLGQFSQALSVGREGRMFYPEDLEIPMEEALVLLEQGNLPAAEACLIPLVSREKITRFGTAGPLARDYQFRHYLGVIYHRQHRYAEAQKEWESVFSVRPDFIPTLVALGEQCLTLARWQDLEQVLGRLEGLPKGRWEGQKLRIQGHLARKELAQAVQQLEAMKQADPGALWPRVTLSQVLLREEKSPEAVEKAMWDVLAIDPHHQPTVENLRLLLEKQRPIPGVGRW